ncbi:MAG: beta-ACP synthase, partial [Planctomycetota bacterium]
GEAAYKVPASSIKASIGHTLGACGAIETVAAIRALEEQVVPPTLNYGERDPECDLDYVPNEARPHRFRTFLKLAAGFGGQNGALIMSAGEDRR